jgi:hypothetical protein
VLLHVWQVAWNNSAQAPGTHRREQFLNARSIGGRAALVLLAHVVAHFELLLATPPLDFSFRRLRYEALWLRGMAAQLGDVSPSLRDYAHDRLRGAILWRGAPRFLRLDELCRVHGTSMRALEDFYMACDRNWPLNDTPSATESETPTEPIASPSGSAYSLSDSPFQFLSAATSLDESYHEHLRDSGRNRLRSKSLTVLGRASAPMPVRKRRARNDSAPV